MRLRMGVAACCVALGIVVSGSPVRAECPEIDFEGFAVDTVVTTQYGGVSFSAPGGACTGDAYIRDMGALGGTSSEFRALSVRGGPGCEFSIEHLRMVFDVGQSDVSFTLGPYCGSYSIQAFTGTVGGVLIVDETVLISDCTSLHGVHRQVHVSSPTSNIRRIEIDGGTGASESIDDLQFGQDTTPPVVQIDEPLSRMCVCNSVPVVGHVDDPDGVYGCDLLEYRAEDDPVWSVYDGACNPWTGTLYVWDAVGLPGGYYFLRVTGNNACELTSSDDTLVYLDRLPPNLNVRSPDAGVVYGGTVCFDGTAQESRGTRNGCFDSYDVVCDWGNGLEPVEPGTPEYTTPVVNDPLASWNTTALGVPDGTHPCQVTAIDICGNSVFQTRDVIVDNTPPAAEITSPVPCSYVEGVVEVRGLAIDAHIDNWVLQYTGDGVPGWVTIANGDANVVDGALGLWDTTDLPHCAYTLRLRVGDSAVVNCNSAVRHVSEYHVSVNVGACALYDGDSDGDVDLVDFGGFQDAFTGPQP